MGGNQSHGTYDKHVVIVGLSYAGLSVAQKLFGHVRITFIDKKNFFDHFTLGIYSIRDPSFLEKTTYPVEDV
jgi:NADH dehydrogenase FAD-containing subunit